MLSARQHPAALPLALIGFVFAVDGLWALLIGSTGAIAYGLIDWPAHLATCLLALLAYTAIRGERPSPAFVAAALLGAVAIDLDHIPGYLGSHLLSGSLPRPATHGLLLVLVLLGGAIAARRVELRQICLGIAFGVSTHLVRDLATGPGIPLLWPLEEIVVGLPYVVYAGMLLATAAACLPGRRLHRREYAGRAAASGVVAAAAISLVVALMLVAPRPAAARVAVGAYIPGADNQPGKIDRFSRQVGKGPALIVLYKDWGQPAFDREQLEGIWRHGAVPMVTWEPWIDGRGVSMRKVANGHFDGYLRREARRAAAWNHPLMVRFGQEMNAPWFPWSRSPGAFRAAWKHVVRVFERAGATRVKWAWTPYVLSAASRSLRRYYPGGRWVDWVGLDGINWGGSYPWRSFGTMFGPSYRRLLGVSPHKPVVIAETGSGESGGAKSRWLSQMLDRAVPRMTQVRAVVFWSVDDSRGDIRVDSSSRAVRALRRALDNPLYTSSRRVVDGSGG